MSHEEDGIRMSPEDENSLDGLEIDLEIADIGELLEKHGIQPTPDLVVALWEWKEARLRAGEAS